MVSFMSDVNKMSPLVLLIIFLLTVKTSHSDSLHPLHHHPHYLVTFKRTPEGEDGDSTFEEIHVEEAKFSPVYKYEPYRNIGSMPGKLENPPQSDRLDRPHMMTPPPGRCHEGNILMKNSLF